MRLPADLDGEYKRLRRIRPYQAVYIIVATRGHPVRGRSANYSR